MKKFVTKDGNTIVRRSRWIKVREAYDVTKRHSLAYYAVDGNGYREDESKFDPTNGTFVSYFIWNGTKWAIDRFLMLGSAWNPGVVLWEEDGKLHSMAGYDRENYHNPIMIELDDCGEYVRVYEEV